MTTSCVLQIQLNTVFTYCMSGTFGGDINDDGVRILTVN